MFTDKIYGFNIKHIVKSLNEEYIVDKKTNHYHVQGELIDLKNEILQIGEFKIDLSDGEIPKDIKQHEYLEADIARIDIY